MPVLSRARTSSVYARAWWWCLRARWTLDMLPRICATSPTSCCCRHQQPGTLNRAALVNTGSFSKVVLSHRAVNQVFFGVFLMFLAFFYSKILAKFHFGTFEPYM